MSEMRFVVEAGVWEEDVEGGKIYRLERTDEPSAVFKDLKAWAKDADAKVELRGTAGKPLPSKNLRAMTWQDVAGIVKDDVSRPGITRGVGGCSRLEFRLGDGELVGVVRRKAGGGIGIVVKPERQGRGYGKALMRAAGREWGVDVGAQHLTHAGAKLVNRIDPRLLT